MSGGTNTNTKIYYRDKDGNLTKVAEMPTIKVSGILKNQKRGDSLDNMRNMRKSNRLINDFTNKKAINNYIKNKDIVLGYVKAIKDRDRKAVEALDRLTKKGYLSKDKKALWEIRNHLLRIARDNPERLNDILPDEQAEIVRTVVSDSGYLMEKKNNDSITLSAKPRVSLQLENRLNLSQEVKNTILSLRNQYVYMANRSYYRKGEEYMSKDISNTMNKLVEQLGLPNKYSYKNTVKFEDVDEDISKLLDSIGYSIWWPKDDK